MGKKKMSSKSFKRAAWPGIAVMLAAGIGGTAAANIFSQSLDTYIGRGERKVTETNIPAESTNYYTQMFTDTNAENGSVSYGASVARKITDEGEVLLKNNGVLPLARDPLSPPSGIVLSILFMEEPVPVMWIAPKTIS